jgi:hypothetical protein
MTEQIMQRFTSLEQQWVAIPSCYQGISRHHNAKVEQSFYANLSLPHSHQHVGCIKQLIAPPANPTKVLLIIAWKYISMKH